MCLVKQLSKKELRRDVNDSTSSDSDETNSFVKYDFIDEVLADLGDNRNSRLL